MTGDFRDFVSKIRCVCLVDEYDNMVSVEKTSPLFQQPILTAHFEDPDDDEDEVEDEGQGEGETDIKGSKGKSSKRHGKRKRGDKAASQEPDEAVLDRLVLICAIHHTLQCYGSPCSSCLYIHLSSLSPDQSLCAAHSPISLLHLHSTTPTNSTAARMSCRVHRSDLSGQHPL